MRDIIVYCDPQGYYGYLKPYIEALVGDARYKFTFVHDQRRDRFQENFGKDCTIWLDRFDDFAIWASSLESTGATKLVCRLRGSEILDVPWQECRWESFDAIVFSNQTSEAIAFDCIDRLDSMAQCLQLPTAVPVAPFNVSVKRSTKNIAYVGPISLESNALAILEILSELVKRDCEYRLYVIGEFESTSLRVHMEYMISMLGLAENIEFHERPADLVPWYHDKTYLLSTTRLAGNEAELALAMSVGVQPVVLNYFGAEHSVGAHCLVNSISECVERLLQPVDSAETLRQEALERHNVLMLRGQFEEILNGPDNTFLPKVSVLLPTFNRASLLKRTLDRLSKQTYPNREIVVVNDCSTDETDTVVKELLGKRTDISYFRNEVNQGNAVSMALAASKATGDFVIPFSDDDDLDDRALEQFVQHWRRKKSDVIYCDLVVTDGEGNEQSRWQYRNYYRTYDLLNTLIFADGNKIPETFFCRREMYDQVYTQTYSRRFINTYYLPLLRTLKITHLPQALYRYAVHTGSTFGNAIGLFDRSKSTQNYINAALLMYAPAQIMSIPANRPMPQRIAEAYMSVAQVLVDHGTRRISGSMYTGASFEASDNLHWVYFYNAFHWLKLAERYGYPGAAAREVLQRIYDQIDPAQFDPRAHANLPDIYRKLPWFANKAFNNLSQFVALDIATLGAPDWLNKSNYTVYSEGKARIEVCNHICRNKTDFPALMSHTPVSVVNIFDSGAVESTVRYLIENQLSSVYVFNFSRIRIPEVELLRTVLNLGPQALKGFDEYLELVTGATTTSNYEHRSVQATV